MQNRQHDRPWWWTLQQESMAKDRQLYDLTHSNSQEKDKQREPRYVNYRPQQTQLHEIQGNLNLPSADFHQPPQTDIPLSVAHDSYDAAETRNDELHAELRQRNLTLQKQKELHDQRNGQAYSHYRSSMDHLGRDCIQRDNNQCTSAVSGP